MQSKSKAQAQTQNNQFQPQVMQFQPHNAQIQYNTPPHQYSVNSTHKKKTSRSQDEIIILQILNIFFEQLFLFIH